MSFLDSTAKFVRLSMLGLTLMAPILGILSASQGVRLRVVIATVLVATCLHIAMYVLNDLVDLDLDRTEPRRAQSPLVRGVVDRHEAGLIVAVAVVMSFVLDRLLLGNGIWREAALAGSFLLLTAYDFYGKRSSFPPFTDFAQGIGCGLVVLYGSLANGGLSALAWTEAGFIMGYFAMINGIHGSLRDLKNDSAHGVRSTAIMLGAQTDNGSLRLPMRLRIYGLAFQTLLAVFGVLALAEAARRAHDGLLSFYLGAVAIIASFGLLIRAYRYAVSVIRLQLAGAAHLVIAIFPALAAAASGHGVVVLVIAITVSIGPLFANGWYRRAFMWLAGFKPPLEEQKSYRKAGLDESQ